MEKLQQVSPYTPYTYLAVKDGVYTLFTIIPIYVGQQIKIPSIDKKTDSQDITYEIEGIADSTNRLTLEPLKLELEYDEADTREPNIGTTQGSSPPTYQIKVIVAAQVMQPIKRHATLKLTDADKRATIPATAYNCPYSYLFKKGTAEQVCLSVIIPLQGFKYHPSLEETIVDKTTKRIVKTITLTKEPMYGEVYGGVAIPPVVTYQYGNGISTTDFFEVEVKLFESNRVSYAKSKPRTMNPDEL